MRFVRNLTNLNAKLNMQKSPFLSVSAIVQYSLFSNKRDIYDLFIAEFSNALIKFPRKPMKSEKSLVLAEAGAYDYLAHSSHDTEPAKSEKAIYLYSASSRDS